MTDAEFAKSLKVGDSWETVSSGFYGAVARQVTVERMTDALVWINGARYNRRTGAGIPRPATLEQLQQARDDAERNKLYGVIVNHSWRAESLATLRSVAEVLKAAKAKREAK